MSEAPQLDERGTEYFLEQLGQSKTYLEYGSGGTTIAAAKQRTAFFTVDSDRFFLAAVRRKIVEEFGSGRAEYIHADIGTTGPWGVPWFKTRTPERMAAWRRYSEVGWEAIFANPELDCFPDLVLIDGRFRVACALTAVKYAPGGGQRADPGG